MMRPKKTDGFAEVVNMDHTGAKEERRDVIADWLLEIRDRIKGGEQFMRRDALLEADEMIKWLHEGDALEG